MVIVVTGAAGLVGSNVVKALNLRGERNIIAVDNLTRGDKFRNLSDCDIADYVDKTDFLALLRQGAFGAEIAAVLHQGACSDTMEQNGRYMMDNNYLYSRHLLEFCQDKRVPYIYASSAAVYGGSTIFREEPVYEKPLNVYGYSKYLFDQLVRRRLPTLSAPVIGLRYFNVYGPREGHKARMASVAWHFFNQYREHGRIKLFEGSGGYAPGEQRRDFISVEDVVKVNLHFFDHPEASGIYNVGTGRAQSFNDVAVATLNAMRRRGGKAALTLEGLLAEKVIEYIPFPRDLASKYQSFTEADTNSLRGAGHYVQPFLTVEEGVSRYVDWLTSAA